LKSRCLTWSQTIMTAEQVLAVELSRGDRRGRQIAVADEDRDLPEGTPSLSAAA